MKSVRDSSAPPPRRTVTVFIVWLDLLRAVVAVHLLCLICGLKFVVNSSRSAVENKDGLDGELVRTWPPYRTFLASYKEQLLASCCHKTHGVQDKTRIWACSTGCPPPQRT